jgi:CDP-paratose synthetase
MTDCGSMVNSKTILLTGGTGFLGANLLSKLVSENCKIILLKRSTSDIWRIKNILDKIISYNSDEVVLEKIFEDAKIDIILHCATNYGRKELDPISLLEANLILPLKLLQLGRKADVPCFINTDTLLDKRVSYYSLSKSHFKDWLRVYSNEMTCINVALEHFYGPYDNESKFVTYIIRNILANVEKIDLTGGKQKRDFIYIDDVVDAFIKIISHRDGSKSGFIDYEIGTAHTISIHDFVTLVKKITGNKRTRLNFGALPYRDNEVMESRVDLTEMRKLNWKQKFSLAEGIEKTIAGEKERNQR